MYHDTGIGKGDRSRTLCTSKTFRDNFDAAFGKKVRHRDGKTVLVRGEWRRPGEVVLVENDNHNLVSHSTGVDATQVAEATKLFGHMGVKYRPDGTAVYRDRQAKLAVMKARGFHDNQEVRGGR